MARLKILHTSDWHLGRQLHEHPRDDEFDAFMTWMIHTIEKEQIDVLLIAGDIFDTSNPSYIAQQRYYNFCTKLSKTCCRHAVITSGNHDSTTFIDVPGAILEHLNIHVVGQARFGMGKSGSPEDEIVVLKDRNGKDECIVAAVPLLTDGDVRYSAEGEDITAKDEKMRLGVAAHYQAAADACERIRGGREIPVIAMGHLYITGGKIVEDDGVRSTYVGNLGGVSASIFSPAFDYVALGHLHVPQIVGNYAHIRYSGAPLPMGFGEAKQQKSVCIVLFDGKQPKISLYPIPQFHRMENIIGDKNTIETQLEQLTKENEEIYVSVTYTGNEYIDSVIELVQKITNNAENVLCLNTQNKSQKTACLQDNPTQIKNESLSDFNEYSVFDMLLASERPDITEEEKRQLTETYHELLTLVNEQ